MLIELRDRILKSILFVGLLGVLCALWAQTINLTAVDIGRHIKNGELILQGQTAVLYKNFYTYTYPDFPFINHHWFFGVMSFLIWKMAGFNGLAIIYILTLLAAFLLFFQVARRYAPFSSLILLSALTLAVISDRREIRPEGISTLFLGVYFYILHQFKARQISFKWLLGFLIPIQIIWVNTHIFFFLGPVLIGLFLWDANLSKESIEYKKQLFRALIVIIGVNLINPSGLGGMLTPLNGVHGFGYSLAENQNIFFMMKRFPTMAVYKWYLWMVAVAFVGMIWAIKRDGIKKHLPFVVLTVFLAAAGIKAVRLMPFFAFFFIALMASFYGPSLNKINRLVKLLMIVAAIGLTVLQIKEFLRWEGIGLMPGVNASAEFYKDHHLKGPIFSNYDIGGYLIYHLSDQEKLFVDNRQEAFPKDFFKDEYIPMQLDPEVWKAMDKKYNFNIVYFYRRDLSPWGQAFLIDRFNDDQWAPIFVDMYAIIFARKGSSNQDVIDHYQLPKSMFKIVH